MAHGRGLVCLSACCALVASCQTPAEPDPVVVPARFEQWGEDEQREVSRVVAVAMGTVLVRLGPEDLSQSSIISVRPPPLGPFETNSPAMPAQFRLVRVETGRVVECYLLRVGAVSQYRLEGLACVPE